MARPKIIITSQQENKIRQLIPTNNLTRLSKAVGLPFYRLVEYLKQNDLQTYPLDGYDKRLQFAKKKKCKDVSEALDRFGLQGFSEMYKNYELKSVNL